MVDQQIQRELVEMRENSNPLVCAKPKRNNLREWEGFILGPPNSPYANGKFNVSIKFPSDYPNSPPEVCVNLFLIVHTYNHFQVKLMTKIYHPNIGNSGSPPYHICLNILKKESVSSFFSLNE